MYHLVHWPNYAEFALFGSRCDLCYTSKLFCIAVLKKYSRFDSEFVLSNNPNHNLTVLSGFSNLDKIKGFFIETIYLMLTLLWKRKLLNNISIKPDSLGSRAV